MSEFRAENSGEDGFDRRRFLRHGGLVAGGAALSAAVVASGAGAQVSAQAVDYTYYPAGPARVYDSRNSPLGPLNNGQGRTLVTGYESLDPPPIAVTLNLTVTQTVGAGWLALFPADIPFAGTSSINWFGNNQDLANNAFVAIPLNGDSNDGKINVVAGGIAGARAHFVLDIIGASAGIDYATAAAADVRSRYATTWTDG
jgi:hypothetical protein